ncbi:NADH-quinone oxidoreductase subunit L [Nocardioides lentus]|uniref:NADH-quinone oxidoreductase subunit L n=2 Tax=Nocardioides lentus TaxID=338077 RepID=A0ABP5AWW0_9ACTN
MLTMTSFATLPLAASPAEVPVVDPAVAEGPFALMWLLIAIPLAGSVILLLGGRATDRWGHLLGTLASVASFALGVVLFVEMLGLGEEERSQGMRLYDWIAAGGFTVGFDLLLDPLSVLFVLLITGVGSLIHVYSIGYMSHDPRRRRFFAYLNLFVAAMLMLVLAGDYLGLFLGWEGVGLASYLLIGFWQHKPSAAAAAKKAFVINRVGDMGLSLAIMLMFVTFGTSSFAGVSAVSGEASETVMTVIGILLLVGACGKSAQVPLQAWLLDAMEGPTPVSALIHAATMVTAGVYLVVRSNFVFENAPVAQTTVVVVACVTLIWGAVIGCARDDIKKVLAGSTMSQIGYMMLAAGLGTAGYAYAIFHLITHGFFKANMFLGAGSVMHGMDDEVDMRRYGALRRAMPITFITFGLGYLAIIGFPFFSGFFSKDRIIETALLENPVAGVAAVIGAGVTAFYMTRLMIMTFFSAKRWKEETHPHESPAVMTGPLVVLATLSVLGGVLILGDWIKYWLAPVVGEAEEHSTPVPPIVFSIGITVVVAIGVALAVVLVGRREVPSTAPTDVSFATRAARADLYGDAINEAVVVGPGRRLVSGVVTTDRTLVDGAVENGALALGGISGRLRRLQNGFVRSYAASVLLGVLVVVGLLLVVALA